VIKITLSVSTTTKLLLITSHVFDGPITAHRMQWKESLVECVCWKLSCRCCWRI